MFTVTTMVPEPTGEVRGRGRGDTYFLRRVSTQIFSTTFKIPGQNEPNPFIRLFKKNNNNKHVFPCEKEMGFSLSYPKLIFRKWFEPFTTLKLLL